MRRLRQAANSRHLKQYVVVLNLHLSHISYYLLAYENDSYAADIVPRARRSRENSPIENKHVIKPRSGEKKTFPYLISVCWRHRSSAATTIEAKAYMFVFGNFVDTCIEWTDIECAAYCHIHRIYNSSFIFTVLSIGYKCGLSISLYPNRSSCIAA